MNGKEGFTYHEDFTGKESERTNHFIRGGIAIVLAIGTGAFLNPYAGGAFGVWAVCEFGMGMEAKSTRKG